MMHPLRPAFLFVAFGQILGAVVCSAMVQVAEEPAVATSSPAFGVASISLPAQSDTLVSAALTRPAALTGQIVSASDNTITLSATTDWIPGQWTYAAETQPDTYYVFMLTGAKAGRTYTVVANGTNTLTVELRNDSLVGIATGDRFRLVPHWTLGTLFPAASAGVAFVASPSVADLKTVLYLTDPLTPGINPTPLGYYFSNNAWRQIGQNSSLVKNEVIVRPGVPFRVRNAAGAGTLVLAGAIVTEKQALILSTLPVAPQDNPVALLRPVPVSLDDAGLIASGAFTASANAAARSDLLMVFDNATTQLNKPAKEFYFYFNNGWRKLGEPLTRDFGADAVFGPAKGVVIRKAPSASGDPVIWLNSQP